MVGSFFVSIPRVLNTPSSTVISQSGSHERRIS